MNIEQYINEKIVKNSVKINTEKHIFPTYRKTVKKNEIITHFGQIERKAYFLISGITESAIQKDGEIRIIDFVFPNSVLV